ncbi:MAG TPA: hypothetical protein VF245_12625 [Solirubrobacterales bacterium]
MIELGRRVARKLAMDLGYSGWGFHRWEVWIQEPGTDLWFWPETMHRKATRRAALRFAWRVRLAPGARIELVNLGNGRHELVRESVELPPDVDLNLLRTNVLSYIDRVAPGRRFPLPGFRKGYADCRKVVDAAFDRQIRQS